MREKTDAHSKAIQSVAFSPDGTKIVSGSNDGTIKVCRSRYPGGGGGAGGSGEGESGCGSDSGCGDSGYGDGGDGDSSDGDGGYSDNGYGYGGYGYATCGGGGEDGWDLGAPEPSNRLSLAKTDACRLIWQARWSC